MRWRPGARAKGRSRCPSPSDRRQRACGRASPAWRLRPAARSGPLESRSARRSRRRRRAPPGRRPRSRRCGRPYAGVFGVSSWADRGDVESPHRAPSGAMRHPLMLATFLVGVLLATPARSAGVWLLLGNVLVGTAGAKPAAAAMLHVRGTEIVDGKGRPVLLRGVAFGNDVWSNVRLPRRHHDETDYQRVAAMGMNAVRFYMNYRTFEADAAPGKYLDDGWQWLADNIAWAKKHGVYLVLNMHVPPGGFQSLGNGKALWDRPEMQERLIALWTAIARHCKGE